MIDDEEKEKKLRMGMDENKAPTMYHASVINYYQDLLRVEETIGNYKREPNEGIVEHVVFV